MNFFREIYIYCLCFFICIAQLSSCRPEKKDVSVSSALEQICSGQEKVQINAYREGRSILALPNKSVSPAVLKRTLSDENLVVIQHPSKSFIRGNLIFSRHECKIAIQMLDDDTFRWENVYFRIKHVGSPELLSVIDEVNKVHLMEMR